MSNFLGKISEKYICLTSQVDVYRNLKEFNFKNNLTSEDEQKIYNTICSSFYKLPYSDRFSFERLDSKNSVIKNFEKGAIYNDNTIYTENSYIGTRDDGLCFIKINCKEHLEITGKIPGVNCFRSSHFAYEIESDLDQSIKFAFNTKLGFLFQDISLVGNGLKMSCFLHLPALNYYKLIDSIKRRTITRGMKFYDLSDLNICDNFYMIEYIVQNEEEFSVIRAMDKFVFEIVNLEIENRRKLLGIKMDYYRALYQKYKFAINSKKCINENIITKFISLCLLLQSLELVVDYDFKFLYNCLIKTISSCFLNCDQKQVRLSEISKDLMGVC